jgi:hypothetical protein
MFDAEINVKKKRWAALERRWKLFSKPFRSA